MTEREDRVYKREETQREAGETERLCAVVLLVSLLLGRRRLLQGCGGDEKGSARVTNDRNPDNLHLPSSCFERKAS